MGRKLLVEPGPLGGPRPPRTLARPGLSDLTPKSGHLKKSQYVDSRRCRMAKKSSRIRPTFTPQFKKDAVALVLGERTVNEVAHDLGIARSLLQRWKTQLAGEPDVPTAF